jgi:hypothetical protein
MPRDTDRPDPYIAAPLGPPIRQAAPAPAPAPVKSPQPKQMDYSDIGMIMRDNMPKAKVSKLGEPDSLQRQIDDVLSIIRRIQDDYEQAVEPYRKHLVRLQSLKAPQPVWFGVDYGTKDSTSVTAFPFSDSSRNPADALNRETTEMLNRMADQLCGVKPSKLNEQQRADWLRMSAEPAPTPELHPRRHLDWPVIDPDMIEQAPRRRAAWLPEVE